MLEVEDFEVYQSRNDNNGQQVIHLRLLVMEATLLLYLGVVLRLRHVQSHLGRNAEVADGEQQQLVDDRPFEVPLLLLLGSERIVL